MTALAVENCSDEAVEKRADCTETGCGDHKGCPSEELDIQLEEIFLVSESTQIDFNQNELELLKTTEVIEFIPHQGDGQFVESPPPLLQPIYILHSSLVFYG